MQTKETRRQLRRLGWKTLDNGRQLEDGRWCVSARSCGHTVVALADSKNEAWSAAWAMAFQCTRNGWACFVDDPRR